MNRVYVNECLWCMDAHRVQKRAFNTLWGSRVQMVVRLFSTSTEN